MAYFPNINKIQYEGAKSTNPYAFKFYNPTEKVGDQTMEEILRFGVAYWHTFTMDGSDPFGDGNMLRPWDKYSGMDLAKARVDAAFEFFEKLDVPYFCFHDVDIAPEGNSLKESNRNIDEIVSMMKDYMKDSKVKLLWNTVNNFTHPRLDRKSTRLNSSHVAISYAVICLSKKMSLD